MPTEPENNIEEQLKAWAARRRVEAGDVELHPATRRLLQDEVARNSPAPQTSPEASRDWLAWLRPRMALALSVVAVMLLVGIVFLPAKPTSKTKSESVLALNERDGASRFATQYEKEVRGDRAKQLAEISSPAIASPADTQSAAPVNAAGRSAATDQFSEQVKSDVRAKRTEPASTVARKLADAESPTQTSVETKDLALAKDVSQPPRDAAKPAAPSVAMRARYGLQRSTATDNRPASFDDSKKLGQAVPSPVLAEQPAAPAAVDQSTALNFQKSQSSATPAPAGLPDAGRAQLSNGSVTVGLSTDQATQRFAQAVKYRRNFNSPPMPNVLTTFQLEQNGQQVRIIDADGSVYEGGFMAAANPAEEATPKAENDAIESRRNVVTTQAANPALSASANNGPAAGQSFAFRVIGTNRSLNQMVVFTGNLLNVTNAAVGGIGAELLQNNAVLLREANVQQQATSNSVQQTIPRLEGQALLGERESIEINATQVGPQ